MTVRKDWKSLMDLTALSRPQLSAGFRNDTLKRDYVLTKDGGYLHDYHEVDEVVTGATWGPEEVGAYLFNVEYGRKVAGQLGARLVPATSSPAAPPLFGCRATFAGRSITMPVWDDVLTPGGKFTFDETPDETPEQRAQAEIERRTVSNMVNEMWRNLKQYMGDTPVLLTDSLKFQFTPEADQLRIRTPEAPVVTFRDAAPNAGAFLPAGIYDYVVTTVGLLEESPASPPTKVHLCDGLEFRRLVLHAEPDHDRPPTIQELAAALAAGYEKPKLGETCGKCKAVVKERALFVGTFVGCLC